VTEFNLPGANPALSKRPHPQDAYYLKGVMVEFSITFLTGDYEGRPGQVLFSGDVGGFTVDNLCLSDARDSGGMNLLTTFPKETKRIRFVWNTEGYETGSYTFLVENFPRSKRQQYSEVPIPMFLAASKADVSQALQNADNETLKRHGLRRLSQVIQARKTSAWAGDINLSDGAVLRSVALPRTPEVGMAIAIVSGSTVVGGGIVSSVNGASCSIDMTSWILRGYESRLGELTAKLAFWSPVRGQMRPLSAEEERWVQGFPDIVGNNPKNRLRDAVGQLVAMDVCHVGDPRQPSVHYWALMQAVTVAKGVWIPVDIQQEVAEQVSVIDWDYTGAPVLAAKDLEKLQASRPGILSVIWNLNPTRNTNNNGSESNSAAASSATATNKTTVGVDVDQQQQQ